MINSTCYFVFTQDSNKAVQAFYTLRESAHEEKQLLVMMLPALAPHMIPQGVTPLLVFVNVKSGGCQGLELISSFRKLLNPYQVWVISQNYFHKNVII
jgi:diacylglycerol kinase (ATP)